MPTSPPDRKDARKRPLKERRGAPGATGATGGLRSLKGLLGRPIGLQRRGSQLHIVLVDRRRAPSADHPPSLQQLRENLRARLRGSAHHHAARAMRHLVFVHDELERKGWAGVAALPPEVLAKAQLQAEMLAGEESSPSLSLIIERLRELQDEADLRIQRDSRLTDFDAGELEVSEATHEEFEEMERSWTGTLPAGLTLPRKDEG